MEEISKVEKFLTISSGSGSGFGYGYGSGSGSGYGSGDGSGDGSGYGYGDGSGYGDGYGDGYGSGYGSGYGYGSGSGYGSGYGDGSGFGDGDGDGSGIKEINGEKVWLIDGVQTLIERVHGNYASGSIIKEDLTIERCYVAKVGNFFAHGDTLDAAFRDAQEKYDENRPLSERIESFIEKFPSLDTVCNNTELFEWHHILTGSCLMGRQNFAKSHDIDVDNGSMTVSEFIQLTEDSYGGDAIMQLKEHYN